MKYDPVLPKSFAVTFAPWKKPEWAWVTCLVPLSDCLKLLTEQILPVLQKVRTIEAAYDHHKAEVFKIEENLKSLGQSYKDMSYAYDIDLLTEAVYFDDKAYFEAHREDVEERRVFYARKLAEGPKEKLKMETAYTPGCVKLACDLGHPAHVPWLFCFVVSDTGFACIIRNVDGNPAEWTNTRGGIGSAAIKSP